MTRVFETAKRRAVCAAAALLALVGVAVLSMDEFSTRAPGSALLPRLLSESGGAEEGRKICPEDRCPFKMFGNLDEELRREMKAELNTKNTDSLARFGSEPLITGDGFRSICKYRCGPGGCNFLSKDVAPGECVFFEDRAEQRQSTQLLEALSSLKGPVVLVSHNSDVEYGRWGLGQGVDQQVLTHPKVQHWFTQNCAWEGWKTGTPRPEKLTCIPIGIENRYNRIGSNPDRYLDAMDLPLDRTRLLYITFKESSLRPQRGRVLNYISSLGDTSRWITPYTGSSWDGWENFAKEERDHGWEHYAKEVRDHKFTLSPLGHGLDCHRTWEVLLLGGIPVVKHSSLDSLYDGLPVVILNDWTELTESRLLEEWDRISRTVFDIDRVFFSYWKKLILHQEELAKKVSSN